MENGRLWGCNRVEEWARLCKSKDSLLKGGLTARKRSRMIGETAWVLSCARNGGGVAGRQ